MANPSYRRQLQNLTDQLRDPFRFRIFVTLVVLGLAYFAIYVPLNGSIEETKRKLDQEQDREMLMQDVKLLRSQTELFEHRLVKDSDVNEWIEYVLNGVRALPVRLINLNLKDERKVGIYRAFGLQLEVSGEMKDLDSLLHWLETNDRLFRVDVMKLVPDRKHQTHRVMQLELLGLKG